MKPYLLGVAIGIATITLITRVKPQKEPKVCTVTAFSATGSVIGKWEHATIVRAQDDWCIIEIPPHSKQVQISGPHTWEEE